MKTVYFLISVLSFLACENNKQVELYSKATCNSFSLSNKKENITNNKDQKINFSILCRYRDFIFVKTDDENMIGIINIRDMRSIYNTYYQKYEEQDFLYKILNLKLKIPLLYLRKTNINIINLDSNILQNYKQVGINYLIKNFTSQSLKHGLEFDSKNLSVNQSETVKYLFYINLYDFYWDDYYAKGWFNKEKEFLLCK